MTIPNGGLWILIYFRVWELITLIVFPAGSYSYGLVDYGIKYAPSATERPIKSPNLLNSQRFQ